MRTREAQPEPPQQSKQGGGVVFALGGNGFRVCGKKSVLNVCYKFSPIVIIILGQLPTVSYSTVLLLLKIFVKLWRGDVDFPIGTICDTAGKRSIKFLQRHHQHQHTRI